MEKLKFAFFGTPNISSQTLDLLFNNGYTPSLIITSPDKKSGRGLILNETPVSKWAKIHNIECIKLEKINQDFINNFNKLDFDLSIVVAYGKILPELLIKTPKLGTINIHYSLLPKYRGASPVESAILNGDTSTGISIQQMAFKLDSGPVLAEKEVLIGINETKEELKNKLIILGGKLLCDILPKIINKSITPIIQDEIKATYCTKIKKEDGEININGNQTENYNKYKAFLGWPGVYFFSKRHDKQIRIKIKQAIYKDDKFIILKVTPEGKKEINYEDFLKQN